MASQEKREFDKYLKFLTFKAAQVVVQSRHGSRQRTKSAAQGNDWFNLTVPDDKQVVSELKRSLEGRLPQPECPVCVEIQLQAPEGDTVVLEVWSVNIDLSKRDIGVSVSHLLYPRLSLMLKSLVAITRTTPSYRLSRHQDDDLKFTFTVYCGPPSLTTPQDFKYVKFAETSCPYGTIRLDVHYRTNITLPSRSVEASAPSELPNLSRVDSNNGHPLVFPFAPQLAYNTTPRGPLTSPQAPFGAILTNEPLSRNDSTDGLTMSPEDEEDAPPSLPALLGPANQNREQDSFVMVDLADIKPAFASRSHTDDLSEFLQQCKDIPTLDLFTEEGSMDVAAALKLIEDQTTDPPPEPSTS